MTLQVESPCVYTSQGVPISVTGIAQVKIQGQNEDMLLTACEQFLGKNESEIQHIALVTLEGHQRAIMGSMTVEEIYKDRKKFSKQVFEVASSDLVNMGITVVSYTLKDIRDEEVSIRFVLIICFTIGKSWRGYEYGNAFVDLTHFTCFERVQRTLLSVEQWYASKQTIRKLHSLETSCLSHAISHFFLDSWALFTFFKTFE